MHRRRRVPSLLVSAASFVVFAASGAHAADVPAIDFARDVQPILSDNCFRCHGPDAGTREGDLRLDELDPKVGPFAARDGYAIITPGKPDDSVLVLRINSDDPESVMPHPKSHLKLTDAQKQTLIRWIEQGAKWGKHWSFEPPVRPAVPDVKQKEWVRNPIDAFILARLEKENLEPSAEAPKATLLRRVTLDLTGLPPTVAELDAFLADTSPDAYEKVVDRLLASPRYGENMVWEWLDAARYSDTNGYQNDPTRTSWPWRDWAVRAMNQNMPFDQFITWQIAGDLLPNPTIDQRLATAFNRNHPFNGEGGRISEETRVENVMDRTDTVGTVFLGLTVGCAKCHDHKFDPISQKEYYSLSAYFNQSAETGDQRYVNGGNVFPVMDVATPDESKKSAELKKAWDDAQAKLKETTPAIDAAQSKWEQSIRGTGDSPVLTSTWKVVRPTSVTSTGGATMEILSADNSVLVSGESPDTDIHEVTLRSDLPSVTGLKIEALPDISLPKGGPGRSNDSGNFVLTDLQAVALSATDPTQSVKLKFSYADATYNQDTFTAATSIDGDPKKTGWAVYMAPDKNNLSAIFALAEPVKFTGGAEIRLRLHYAFEDNRKHTMGRFRLSLTGGPVVPPALAAALSTPADKRDTVQKKTIRDFYRTRVSTEYKALADAVATAKKASQAFDAGVTKVMVMDDSKPRDTFVLSKGSYDKPTDKVQPGTPAILNALPKTEKNNRLALAQWVVSPDNPLTARVTVNRYWQHFFGTGIVKTTDDFGVQGERPVHPQLLDYLATDFVAKKWDVKRLHRLIVTSSAYRQSSRLTPDLIEKDPENRLLARGPRYRLPSPTLRDQALAASGLFVEQLGGPPVKPYQPPGIWEEATFGIIKYDQDHGPSLYRRSLYTFWRRIVGPTNFFDAPSRSVCTVRPNRTNTPLHALTTLNDPTYVEAARALAQHLLESPATTPADRLTLAYRTLLSRKPTDKEQTILLASLSRLISQYASDKESALKLLKVGESPRNEKLDTIEHAAYTTLCLGLLNLDETLNKE